MRNRYLLLADMVAILMAAWAAYAFRFGWLFSEERPEFATFLILALVVKVGMFFAFGIYRRYWRYAGFWDLMAIVLANSAGSILLGGLMVSSWLLGWVPEFPRSVSPLDWLFALALTVGIRASLRAIAETVARGPGGQPKPRRSVLIVGAGEAGLLVAREMQRNRQLGLEAVGFLDDDPRKLRKQIHGLPVFGALASLADVANIRHIDEVVIAIPTAGGRTVRNVVEQCQGLGIPSRVMPGIYELLDGQFSVSRLRNVDIADLLRRPQIHAPSGKSAYLQGGCVLITGAGGSIGSELCRQVAHAGPSRLLVLGHGENSVFEIAAELHTRFPGISVEPVIADIRDRERVHRILTGAQPQVVFHAAAHKHVPLMEGNASEAVTNNIMGTRSVVDAAVAAGVSRLVMVSTDKAAAPSNMMGASKRVAELIVQRAARTTGRAFVVVRFGNVLGSRGSVVPIFKSQIEHGGPVTVTHPDVRRYFMTIPEAVHLILQAGGLGAGGELFVLDMGEPVLLREMAADMIRLSGFDEAEVPIVFTGLRPGEKLNEVLWEEHARVESTSCSDIRRVYEATVAEEGPLDEIVGRLVEAAARDDRQRIAQIFRECIPSASLAAQAGGAIPQRPSLVAKTAR